MFRSLAHPISHIVVNKVFTVMDDHHLCSPIEHLREETRMQKCLMIKLQNNTAVSENILGEAFIFVSEPCRA